MATADVPQGPFRQEVKQPIWDEKSIDTSLFIDDDGTPYLYFVRFTDGNVIWVAEMNDDLTGIKQETLTECIKVGEPWELSQDKPAKVAEGPSILKKEGVYYLVYSANHFESKNYGVGYATSNSPMGPWKKYEGNPILQHADGLMGTGHGAPFCCKDGSWKYISMHIGIPRKYSRALRISRICHFRPGNGFYRWLSYPSAGIGQYITRKVK